MTAPQIFKYTVSLPPTLAEQQAIAEALSDADALIKILEQLIAKKRLIKQALYETLHDVDEVERIFLIVKAQ